MENTLAGPFCYRCKRPNTKEQLAVLFNAGGASKRYCVDTRDCEDFQFKEGKYAATVGDSDEER